MTSATILVGPLLLLVSWVTIYIIKGAGLLPAFGFLKLDNAHSPLYIPSESSIDDLWYPSSHGDIDNLDSVANASGTSTTRHLLLKVVVQSELSHESLKRVITTHPERNRKIGLDTQGKLSTDSTDFEFC